MAEEVQQADSVDMAVHVVRDDDERPVRQGFQPLRIPDAEIYADVVQDGPGER